MPRSLDPGARLTMVLACDVDKPAEIQPRIFAKSPTLNQQRKLLSVMTSLEKTSNVLEQFDSMLDMAALLITGWENIDIPYSRDALGDVLTADELVEVLTFLMGYSQATPDDKKKSELPHSSDAVNSANPV